MGYSADSFTAGEQPTTAKWNKLWANDAAFNDGTGIGTNAIAAASLATNAITLGYAQITSNFTTASTSAVQVTGLTVTVTIPAGSRRIKFTIFSPSMFTSAASTVRASLWDGTVGSGTLLQFSEINQGSATNTAAPVTLIASATPAAGSKTYNVGLQVGAGTGTLFAGTTSPSFILVEVI